MAKAGLKGDNALGKCPGEGAQEEPCSRFICCDWAGVCLWLWCNRRHLNWCCWCHQTSPVWGQSQCHQHGPCSCLTIPPVLLPPMEHSWMSGLFLPSFLHHWGPNSAFACSNQPQTEGTALLAPPGWDSTHPSENGLCKTLALLSSHGNSSCSACT